jgi:hypothetical protein
VPELALVQICKQGVPFCKLRVRGAQRLQVLQRRSHVCESERERAEQPVSISLDRRLIRFVSYLLSFFFSFGILNYCADFGKFGADSFNCCTVSGCIGSDS